MMHNASKIGIAIALLALTACSQLMLDEVVMVEEPTALGAPAASAQSKHSCGSTDIDDGIGGTGCPTPLE